MAESKISSYKRYCEINKISDYGCIIHIDGGCRGNRIATVADANSIGSAAFVVVKMPEHPDPDWNHNKFVFCKGTFHKARTNNELEYEGLLMALRQIKQEVECHPDFYTPVDGENFRILIQCDSQLIVNQVVSGWAVNVPRLKKLNLEACELISELYSAGVEVDLKWFGREYNVADAICNLVMDLEANVENVEWAMYSGAKLH